MNRPERRELYADRLGWLPLRPSEYAEPSRKSDAVKGSRVFWDRWWRRMGRRWQRTRKPRQTARMRRLARQRDMQARRRLDRLEVF